MTLQKLPNVGYKSRSRRKIITVIKTNKSIKHESKAFSHEKQKPHQYSKLPNHQEKSKEYLKQTDEN